MCIYQYKNIRKKKFSYIHVLRFDVFCFYYYSELHVNICTHKQIHEKLYGLETAK